MYVIKLEDSVVYESIFEQLDERLEEFNIKTYNLRKVSLEEVFYKIGEEEYKKEVKPETQAITNEEESELDSYRYEKPSDFQIIKALAKRRRIVQKR